MDTYNHILPILGLRLKAAREARGWEPDRLSVACGVPADDLLLHERGDDSLTAEQLVAAARALGMPLWFLFELRCHDSPLLPLP